MSFALIRLLAHSADKFSQQGFGTVEGLGGYHERGSEYLAVWVNEQDLNVVMPFEGLLADTQFMNRRPVLLRNRR